MLHATFLTEKPSKKELDVLNVPKKMRKYLEDSSSESDEENQNPENLSESSTAQLSDCTRIKSHQSRSPIHPHKKAYQLSSPSLKGKPTTIGREEYIDCDMSTKRHRSRSPFQFKCPHKKLCSSSPQGYRSYNPSVIDSIALGREEDIESYQPSLSSQTELLLDLHRKVTKLSDAVGYVVKFLKQSHKKELSRDLFQPGTCSPSPGPVHVKEESTVQKFGVDLLSVGGADPAKYSLAFMDVLFSDEQLRTCCFMASSKSKKPGLPAEYIQTIQEHVDQRFGRGAWGKNLSEIKRKCNQKCIDKANKYKKTDEISEQL